MKRRYRFNRRVELETLDGLPNHSKHYVLFKNNITDIDNLCTKRNKYNLKNRKCQHDKSI